MIELRRDARRNRQVVVTHPGDVKTWCRHNVVQIFKGTNGFHEGKDDNFRVGFFEIGRSACLVRIMGNTERDPRRPVGAYFSWETISLICSPVSTRGAITPRAPISRTRESGVNPTSGTRTNGTICEPRAELMSPATNARSQRPCSISKSTKSNPQFASIAGTPGVKSSKSI